MDRSLSPSFTLPLPILLHQLLVYICMAGYVAMDFPENGYKYIFSLRNGVFI